MHSRTPESGPAAAGPASAASAADKQEEDEPWKHVPACRRCRLRKQRCDRGVPKCSHCTTSKTACIVVDPITSQQYPRDYIQRLQQRERELRAQAEAARGSGSGHTAGEHRASPAQSQASPGVPGAAAAATVGHGSVADSTPASIAATISTTARPSGFVGDGSGLNFLHHVLSDVKWQAYKPQILQHLAQRDSMPESNVSVNPKPLIEEASALLDNYFARFHINHTFLLRREVLDIFNRIYSPGPSQSPSAQDYFRLFMVFALSAVTRYRRGLSNEHPFGYYLAAQEYLSSIPLIGTLDAIENLLLVARFGMYHHIGTSLWEIGRFSLRSCIELGLHAKPRRPLSPLDEQHRRRIFWECYILDCYSSGVLGRPFSMNDNDITVDLPLDADDETIILNSSMNQRLSDIHLEPAPRPTELSVFLFCIKLRKITSRVYAEFYARRGTGSSTSGEATPLPHFSSGHVYVKLHQFLDELEAWRRSAPVFETPRSLYERTEWHDWMLEKDKLSLLRGAMHNAPRKNGHAPDDLLLLCLDCAMRVIELYGYMEEINCITWTRSYFQIIFAAGMCIIYAVSVGVHKERGVSGAGQPAKSLALCSDILQRFRKEMPDAGRFAIVFEILKDNLLRELSGGTASGHEDVSAGRQISRDQELGGNGLAVPIDAARTDPQQTLHGINLPMHPDLGQYTALPSQQQYPPGDAARMPLSPISNDQSGLQGMDYTMDLQNQELVDWPVLTDEMMEHLEAGLGQFAWGALDMNLSGGFA